MLFCPSLSRVKCNVGFPCHAQCCAAKTISPWGELGVTNYLAVHRLQPRDLVRAAEVSTLQKRSQDTVIITKTDANIKPPGTQERDSSAGLNRQPKRTLIKCLNIY